MAFSPEIRIMAIAPAPEGVAKATIESFEIIFLNQFYAKVSKNRQSTSSRFKCFNFIFS